MFTRSNHATNNNKPAKLSISEHFSFKFDMPKIEITTTSERLFQRARARQFPVSLAGNSGKQVAQLLQQQEAQLE